MTYFYGPVPSRRLGFSLGLDLIPRKICSFDCVYCQLGKTTRKSLRRFSSVNLQRLKKELRQIIKRRVKIDYITLSGCGEPTLHKDLDKIVSAVKKITKNKYPVCLITNSSLLHRKDVRNEIKEIDLIIPSLDAVSPRVFKNINNPHKSLAVDKIISGLKALKKNFKGEIWLEIMLVAGRNDSVSEAIKFRKIISRIRPDKVQLNLPTRPSENQVKIPSFEKIKTIKKILGCAVEVISPFKNKQQTSPSKARTQILTYLLRRPATAKDLINSLAIDDAAFDKIIKSLLRKNKIMQKFYSRKNFFTAAVKRTDDQK
ncbi:MAG: radical SAM protein [Candidatus Omnitrophica bacterium]|nr:radical SAM protein [Candidatus Omnitrophota bacterium]